MKLNDMEVDAISTKPISALFVVQITYWFIGMSSVRSIQAKLISVI